MLVAQIEVGGKSLVWCWRRKWKRFACTQSKVEAIHTYMHTHTHIHIHAHTPIHIFVGGCVLFQGNVWLLNNFFSCSLLHSHSTFNRPTDHRPKDRYFGLAYFLWLLVMCNTLVPQCTRIYTILMLLVYAVCVYAEMVCITFSHLCLFIFNELRW